MAAWLALGCSPASVLTVPHQPYAALLDHPGQLDIVARGGVMDDGIRNPSMSAALQAAYAPVDHLEIAASADADLYDTGESGRTLHGGGGLAIGVFAGTRNFRFEALLGGDAGWAAGVGERDIPSGAPFAPRRIDVPLESTYGDAFAQLMFGVGRRIFTWTLGARYVVHVAQARAASVGETTTYAMGILDVFMTFRVALERARIELMLGIPGATSGWPPLAGAAEIGWWPYALLGAAVDLDTVSHDR